MECDGLSLEQAQAFLTNCLEATQKIAAGGQEYEIETPSGRRRVKQADLRDLWETIGDLRALIRRKTSACKRRSRFSLASFNHDRQDL